ncbi:hypothetical protein O3M35_012458 [Rhynocoris fuscipes]|uniref:HD domain-containing protein n=1 Tax=Rhynocoris fuscipes TaxID=488301 RepID=A0AAW1CU14_9HEMI
MSPNETDAVKRQRSCTAARISTVEEETSDDSHSDSEMEEEAIYINDPVHGMLEIHPLCKAVIDTPEFQRLRFIKQCGISYFVYPGATHTRFDHSLGVCYLALKVVKRLNELESNAVSPEESLCIQLAGLCHDLGHGPFSHFWEYFVSYATNTKFHHEDMSIKIFDYLIEKNSLREKFAKYGLYDEHLQLIKDLIMGTPSRYKTMTPELFLFEIVANKENGLDIDKYEYLIKDSYFFGTEVSPDFERYLTCLKIVEDPELGVKHIGYREKLKTNIISVFKHRAVMHDIGYQHRVCKKIEAIQ